MQKRSVSKIVTPRHPSLLSQNHYCIGNGNPPHCAFFRHIQTSYPSPFFLSAFGKSWLCLSNVRKKKKRKKKKRSISDGNGKHTCFALIISTLNSMQNNCFLQLPKIKSRSLIAKKQNKTQQRNSLK